MANRWDVGDQPQLKLEVRDAAGVLVDPGTVALTVRKPSGATITPPVVRDGVGLYHATVQLDEPGVWRWQWSTSGSLVLVEGDERYVYPSRV